MSLDSDLKTALETVCPRVFPDFAPVGTTRPYITFLQIGGYSIRPIGKTVPDKRHAEFQIDWWADTRASAKAVADSLDSTLRQASAFAASPMAEPVSDYDADMKRFGARQDWSIWGSR